MSYIGLDVHKKFIQAAVVSAPSKHPQKSFTIPTNRDSILAFAASLSKSDRVALESTTNAFSVANLLRAGGNGAQVVVSNPMQAKVIAMSKVKTDKVDALALANMLAADYLPTIWEPDHATNELRKITSYYQAIISQKTAVKNRIHSILHRNLIEYSGFSDLFGKKGRKFLFSAPLPEDDLIQVNEELDLLDYLDKKIVSIKERLAKKAVADDVIRRLMTITGIDLYTAASLKAAIGNDISRFSSPKKLVGYFGLASSVYQSAESRHTGRITKRGNSQARWVLVQAAQVIVKYPSPLRAFFLRLRARRGRNKAIVAVAAKLTRIIWQMLTKGEDYFYAPPLRTKEKLARLRIIATSEKVKPGPKPGALSGSCKKTYLKACADDKVAGKVAEAEYVSFIKERYFSKKPSLRSKLLS